MDPIYLEFAGVLIVWGGWELFVSLKKRDTSADAMPVAPRYLLVLWSIALVSIATAIGAAFLGLEPLTPYPHFRYVGFAMLALGILVRAHAIYTLGRFFSVHVEMQAEHQLIQTGLYRYVRHPSYTGFLLSLLGLGLALGNVLSLLLAVIPMALAIHYRIHIEEQALQEAFGEAYAAYCQRTKRLIPWIY